MLVDVIWPRLVPAANKPNDREHEHPSDIIRCSLQSFNVLSARNLD